MEKPQKIIELENIIGKEIKLIEGSFKWDDVGYKINENGEVIGLHLLYYPIKNMDFVKHFYNLTELDILVCKISDISALSNLSNITSLSLNVSQVSDISVLSKLTNINRICINGGGVSDISSLENLSNLVCVSLMGNKIKYLPEWIVDFGLNIVTGWKSGFKNYINLENNPLEYPPYEVVAQGNDSIRAYFEAAKNGKSALNEIKILLVGDGSAGKTSLSKLLRDEPFNEQESQTHGINIHRWMQDDIKLNLWDFGGQEMMHSTHQFFLSKRSIYILVLDGRKEEDVDYWLKHIRSFGGDSPVLIALNKHDQNPSFDLNRRQLLEKYPNIHGFYKISCKDGTGLAELQQGFKDALKKVSIIRSIWPTTWFDVKQALENINKDYINSERYEEICDENKVTDVKTREVIAETLRALGVIVHFPDMDLRDTHVLQPRWITEAVYKIINSKQLAEKKGVLCLDCLSAILEKKSEKDLCYPSSKYAHIIRLMEKFELCYRMEDDKSLILIPDLLDIQQPEYEIKGELLRFRFEYDFLPKSIVPRFMVKRHKDIQDKLCWRTGVVLHDASFKSTAMIRADYDKKLIDIQVTGEQKRDFFSIIRKTFHDIHQTFEQLEVKELIPLPGYPRFTVPYKVLRGYEKTGRDVYFDGEILKEFSVRKLLDGIEEPEKRKNEMSQYNLNITNSTIQGSVVAADTIKESFNQQQTPTNSSGNETQQLLEALLKEIQALNGKIPDATIQAISEKAQMLIEETKREQPRKHWYQVSLEGIMDAVKPIEFGVKVFEIAQKLQPLLVG